VELGPEFDVGLDMYLVVQIQPGNGLHEWCIRAALLGIFSTFGKQPFLTLGWDGRRRSQGVRRARHCILSTGGPLLSTRSMFLRENSEKGLCRWLLGGS
jgi:hypothetical protein